MSPAILAEGLIKRFGDTLALDGVDLAVRPGTVLGLLGPNGAGKTTAVRILATLIRPDAGHASIHGHDVVRDAHEVRKLIGLTGQYASVDDKLTGSENLILIARLLGLPRDRARQRARALLADFQLEGAADRAALTYSGGMRRRLDLAASLVGHPRILYLDEPTTGLDPRARLELWKLIRGLVADGVSVLLTTQYLEEADALADDIAVLDRGRIIAAGAPEDLKARIGARTLAIRVQTAGELSAATALIRELTGNEPEVDGRRLSAPVGDPALLPAVVRKLDEAGIVVDELSLRGASLDDVFLTLTGHRAQAVAEPAPDAYEPAEGERR